MINNTSYSRVSLITTVDPFPGIMDNFMEKLSDFSKDSQYSIELIIVDSLGHLDEESTARIASKAFPFEQKVLSPGAERRDQLKAILWALPEANGDVVIVIDPDMYENISDIPRFITSSESGNDVVYGRRVKRKGTPLWRLILSNIYNLTTRIITGISIHDFNSPMVLLSRSAVATVTNIPTHETSARLLLLEEMKTRLSEIEITVCCPLNKPSNYTIFPLIRTGFIRQAEVIQHLISKHRRSTHANEQRR